MPLLHVLQLGSRTGLAPEEQEKMRSIERCILIFISRSIATCVPARLESKVIWHCCAQLSTALPAKSGVAAGWQWRGAQTAELQCALVAAKSAAEKHCANIATTTTW